MSSFERWVGKVAIVTGASSGIGAETSKKLVQKGLIVVGLARRHEVVHDLAKTLEDAPGKLHALNCDITKEEDILKAFKWVCDNLGPVHILVNNAGLNRSGNLIEGETKKWREIFDVNVIGLLIATREAVKIMRENNIDGHIINMNSGAGHYDRYFPTINVYPASKHAVTNLTETLRKEFNANNLKIKVTSISPGPVDTEFNQAAGIHRTDLQNVLYADDIADAILYALSTKPHVQLHEIMMWPVGYD